MRTRWIGAWAAIALMGGCYALPPGLRGGTTLGTAFPTGGSSAVITQTWQTGFVPSSWAHTDVMTVYGDGHWTGVQTFNEASGSATVASGSMPAATLQALVDQAFRAPSPLEPPFVELPAVVPSHVTDIGTTRIGLTTTTGSHSVSTAGEEPMAYKQLWSAIASATTPLPLPTPR